MNKDQYTPEQQKDIEERVQKALSTLEELQLYPACIPSFHNDGKNVFGIKLTPYLQDKKYTPVISNIQT